jgi:ankyrin repeat protein
MSSKWSRQLTRKHQLLLAFIVTAVLMSVFTLGRISASELSDAIRFNDLQLVRTLVEADPGRVNERDEDRDTPLHIASQYGDEEIVTYLVTQGADATALGQNSLTPLHLTTDAEIARILIRNGADLKSQSSGSTALDRAVSDGNVELIDVLLDAGEELTFEHLVELGDVHRVMTMLKDQASLAQAPRKCLHLAARNGNLEIVRLLLDYGADPNLDYGYNNIVGDYTPLSAAVISGHYEITKFLCERGADPDASGGRNHGSVLHRAVAEHDVRLVRLLLDHGADANLKQDWGSMSPLLRAVELGDFDLCQLLVEHDADITVKTRDGVDLMTLAACQGDKRIGQLLLEKGAGLSIHTAIALGKADEVRQMIAADELLVNDLDDYLHQTPLAWAAMCGHLELVKLLIDNKANVNAGVIRDDKFMNLADGQEKQVPDALELDVADHLPLQMAAAMGHTDIIRVLLQHSAIIDATGTVKRTPLWYAVEYEKYAAVKLLLEHDATISDDSATNSILSLTCNNLEITELLLSRNPSPVAVNEALRHAVIQHHFELSVNKKVIDRLLAAGAVADIHTACILGQTARVSELIETDRISIDLVDADFSDERPLQLAAAYGHAEIVQMLIDCGAEMDVKNDSALASAAGFGQLEAMKLLLQKGANIEGRNWRGSTPLISAAAGGHPEAVKLLIECGAQILSRDSYRNTALHEAASYGTIETIVVLLEAGMPVDSRNALRETALHVAASRGDVELVTFLLKAGADVNARNRRGQFPLYYAEREIDSHTGFPAPDRTAVGDVLREHGGIK